MRAHALSDANDSVWRELETLHAEKHRAYHNLEHVLACLGHLDHYAAEEPKKGALELAFWFHDAIYEVPGPDNEANSAALARQLLADEGYPDDRIEIVEQIILDTKVHHATIEPARIVIDLDLAPLGVPWAHFCTNAEALMREHANVSKQALNVIGASIESGEHPAPASLRLVTG